MNSMQPKFNVWLEHEGNVVLSPWRVQLLETIAATGSISAAAKQLDLPYRRAWEKVHAENITRDAIRGGMKATAAYAKFGVL